MGRLTAASSLRPVPTPQAACWQAGSRLEGTHRDPGIDQAQDRHVEVQLSGNRPVMSRLDRDQQRRQIDRLRRGRHGLGGPALSRHGHRRRWPANRQVRATKSLSERAERVVVEGWLRHDPIVHGHRHGTCHPIG